MSEKPKDEIIRKVYYDKSGLGSIQSTYKKAQAILSFITLQDVKDWFFKNVEDNRKSGINNKFINDRAYQEYQIDLIFFGKEEEDEDEDDKPKKGKKSKAKVEVYKHTALSMIDIFSKFAVVIPMENKKGPTVNGAAMAGIRRMNPDKHPDTIYCDNDTLFQTSLVQLMKELKIHLYITKHSAMVNERFNRTFKDMIWKRLKASGKDKTAWTSFIDEVLTTYNYQMVSTATGMTPYEARKPENTLQVKIALEMHRGKVKKYPTLSVGDYVKTFYKKPTQKKKEHESNWNPEVYKVERTSETFGQKYYHLEGLERTFLRHDLKKVPAPT